MRRVMDSSMAIAWSATSVVFTPGVLQTHIPSSVAAFTSMQSTPTPWRPITFSLGIASSTRRGVRGRK